MAKDPAFLWYPGDWLGGTSTFSRFLKGAYIDLLMAQFNAGALSLEEIKTVLGSDFGQAWPAIQKKFKQTDTGLFFNERLQLEKERRQEYVKSRGTNRSGTTNHMKNISNSYESSYEKHMENRNENVNEDQDEGLQRKKGFVKPSKQHVQNYFTSIGINGLSYEKFYDHYESNGWKVGKNSMKSWEAAVRNWVKNSGKYDPPNKNNGLSGYHELL